MPVSSSGSADEPSENMMEIEEEVAAALQRSDSCVFSRCNSIGGSGEAEEPLYIAVGKDYKESKPTVIWALASLIGACPEEHVLVYEFVPNGSLEDHLIHKCQAPALSWQARISISAGISSALIFLHSSKPQPIIHGDLRPANILLDHNLVSKVTDFGLVRLIDHSTSTIYNWNDPKGAFAYMDPEFFSTGELTARSDVYSFGIIILRLLTGKPALGIVKEVQEALESERLQSILDSTAGDWPVLLAQQLALLGLKCSEMKRKSRPDLVKDVWKILESFKVLALP